MFSNENMARVSKVLPMAGFPEDAQLAQLASEDGLKFGRKVLLFRCAACCGLGENGSAHGGETDIRQPDQLGGAMGGVFLPHRDNA